MAINDNDPRPRWIEGHGWITHDVYTHPRWPVPLPPQAPRCPHCPQGYPLAPHAPFNFYC